MNAVELRAITDKVVGSLERGIQEEVGVTDFLGPELQLRYSVCGLATAALERYFAEAHGVATTRVIVNLPETPPSMQVRHVFLRHAKSITIDPTYSQFYEYAGILPHDAVENPQVAAVYPAEKIAVVDDKDCDLFIARLALDACSGAQSVLGESHRSVEELDAIFRGIWQPTSCKRFPAPQDPMVDRIVDGMKRSA